MTPHLTHEQLCDLLLFNRTADSRELASERLEASREHVRDCHICAGELALLTDSLTLFRSTADAWASHEWNHQSLLQSSKLKVARPRPISGLFPRPAIWAATAAAAIAIAVPITLYQFDGGRHSATNSATVTAPRSSDVPAQSDEALLEEISQTVSSSVPGPMEALADPTASQTSNTQRKN
jgi:hypothetical protein